MSSGVEVVASAATGGSSTAVTVRVTVATFESARPSFTLKVNESEPLQFATGVYVRVAPAPLREPCDGPLTTV